MEKTVLVIGATGMLGRPVARRLRKEGFQVRAMTRDSSKARGMFDGSFEIAVGDVRDRGVLEKLLNGCFGVHISFSGEFEQVGVENVASVASKKGVGRITYTSADNVSEENAWFPWCKQKLLAEKAIRESGLPYTTFCPTTSMESVAMFIQGNRAFIIGKHPKPYHFFAADDYARMVSASYRLEETVNKRFFVHGPEAILLHDAVKRYCSVLHPEMTRVSTMPYWLVNLMAAITRNKEMKFGSGILAFCEKTGEEGDPTEANRILGAPRIRLDRWLEQRETNLATPIDSA